MKWFLKRKIIKRFVRELPLILKKLYGKHNIYSEDQINAAFVKAGYKLWYLEYAYSIFMSKSKFEETSLYNNGKFSYDKLRSEIASSFFNGNKKFTIHDIMSNASTLKKSAPITLDYRNVGVADIEGASYIINDD